MKKVLLFTTMIILLVLVACTSSEGPIKVAKDKRIELNLAQKMTLLSKTEVPNMDKLNLGMSLKANLDFYIKLINPSDFEDVLFLLDGTLDADINGHVKLSETKEENYAILNATNLLLEYDLESNIFGELLAFNGNISYHLKNSYLYVTHEEAYLRVFANEKTVVNEEEVTTKTKFDERMNDQQVISDFYSGFEGALSSLFGSKETTGEMDLNIIEDLKFLNDMVTVYEMSKGVYVVHMEVNGKIMSDMIDESLEDLEDNLSMTKEQASKLKEAFNNYNFDLKIEIIDKVVDKVTLSSNGKITYKDPTTDINIDIRMFEFEFLMNRTAPTLPKQETIKGFKLVEEFSSITAN